MIFPIILFFTFFNQLLSYNEIFTYMFRIKFPYHIENAKVCAYFKGYKLEFENDLALILQHKPITNLFVVITEQVNNKKTANNIRYLERIKNKNCRFFYVTRKFDNIANEYCGWKIHEEDSKNIPIKIPEKSIVILLNPNFVSGLSYNEADNFCDNKNLISLPTLKIKSNIKQKDLNKSCLNSCMNSFNTNTMHINNKKNIQHYDTVIIKR